MRSALFFICLLPSVCAHAVELKSNITLSPRAMSYTGASNAITPGQIIGSSWNSSVDVKTVFYCGVTWPWLCTEGFIQPTPNIVSAGMSVNFEGVNYAVYETGAPGIGFILGIKDFNGTQYIPLQADRIKTFPADGTSSIPSDLGWSAKVTYVKTAATLKTGTYTIPSIYAAELTAYDSLANMGTAPIFINATTITVSASGCTVGADRADINLGTLDVSTLPSVGSTSPSGSFNVNLTCDPLVSVNAVITDQTTPSNTTSVATLTSDSTASGIGVQFIYNGTPMPLGPDSSAEGTTNQFFIQSTSNATQTLSLPFQARYIRTGDITPGTANALASITFSYQ
ncbi:TPA: fimbrial protein [Enterobacter chengduensis]|nr:fimbrial protein [Enterobacter chengduensis]